MGPYGTYGERLVVRVDVVTAASKAATTILSVRMGSLPEKRREPVTYLYVINLSPVRELKSAVAPGAPDGVGATR